MSYVTRDQYFFRSIPARLAYDKFFCVSFENQKTNPIAQGKFRDMFVSVKMEKWLSLPPNSKTTESQTDVSVGKAQVYFIMSCVVVHWLVPLCPTLFDPYNDY